MQRASNSIGAIAGALAKAQAELSNPEKSLTGTISSPLSGAKTFRYAPLSSGLDIVRKILGKHEIATVQTTAIDTTAGLIRLTTVLAHSSGEWVSSDWPVCAVSETAAPHRMGAALTYARRYALFTLVGIAGEDDLDAPDVASAGVPKTNPENKAGSTTEAAAAEPVGRRASTRKVKPSAPVLAADASMALRDKLTSEIGNLGSIEAVTEWAKRGVAIKNTLSIEDARSVESVFRTQLAALEAESLGSTNEPPSVETVTSCGPSEIDRSDGAPPRFSAAADDKNQVKDRSSDPRAARVDKAVLTLAEPRRHRDKEHLRFIAQQPCTLCGRQPSEPHHLRFAQQRALSRKVSDEFTVPLCRLHHREIHRYGNEPGWWKGANIDPVPIALGYWQQTRGLLVPVMERHPSQEAVTSPLNKTAAAATREIG